MATRSSLSSTSSPHCAYVSEPSHSSSPSPSPTTLDTPSIYVTFKVLQLVNAFRRRVTRKLATKKVYARKTAAQDFCQDFERQAFDEIDRYLGRKTRRPSSKRTKLTEDTALTPTAGATKASQGKGVDRLLRKLNHSVRFEDVSVLTVAKSNRLFLERQSSLSIDRLNVRELCELLVTVKNLQTFLKLPSSDRVICEGKGLSNFAFDETLSANFQHLLDRLEVELLRLLVARLVELVHRHVKECQRDQSKRSEEWFSEFPDARHPLSTTWPWSIKPSLAVIWGVCWMFYDRRTSAPTTYFDKEGNMVKENGEIELPADQVIAYLTQQQQHIQRQPQFQQPQTQTGEHPRQAMALENRLNPSPISPSATLPQNPRNSPSRLPHQRLRNSLPHQHHHTSDQAAHATSGIALHTNNSTAFATQPPYATGWTSTSTLPEDNFTAPLAFDNAYSPTAAVAGSWNQGIPVSYPGPHSHAQPQLQQHTRPGQFDFGGQGPLPQRSRHPSAPAIRVTTDFPQQYHQQPQDFHDYSAATSLSTNSSIPLQETFPNYQHQFNQAHLSPHSPYMADTLPPPQPDAREMQVTTPPRSPQDMPPMGEPMTRKRSHSQISNGPPFQAADGSHHGSQVGDHEFGSPGRIEIHRPDPLMNSNRKYLCNFGGEECGHLTFDRKCEWSKHMDKHDRPYRCPDSGCAKLQGFTYSGGLLRHEREVHGKHGGPKAQLRCPHEDCKRHTGKGFTRKENLNEHIRRVHQNRDQPSQTTDPSIIKHDTAFDALAGAARALDETAETPASRVSEAVMVEDPDLYSHSPAVKRRRHMPPGPSDRSASEDVEDLRRQIEYLQSENAQKDQRLHDMERMMAEMDRKFQEQQRAQNEWHEQQQAAAAAAAIASAAQQA